MSGGGKGVKGRGGVERLKTKLDSEKGNGSKARLA